MLDLFAYNYKSEISGEKLNSYNKKFYTIVNKEKYHNDLNYDIGEILDPIDTDKKLSTNGRLFFSTIENMARYNDMYGCYFCEIKISNDAICYVKSDYIKANKFIIKKMTYIKNASQSKNFFHLETVKQNGLYLKFIDEKSEEICLEVVKQNGLALRFV